MADPVAQRLAEQLRARGFRGADFERATGVSRAVFDQIARGARGAGYGRAYRHVLLSALESMESGGTAAEAQFMAQQVRRGAPVPDPEVPDSIPEMMGAPRPLPSVAQRPETVAEEEFELTGSTMIPFDTREIIARARTGVSRRQVRGDVTLSFDNWREMFTKDGKPSSRVARAAYNAEHQVLRVEWRNNGVHYDYHGVPENIWKAFYSSASPGRFVNEVLNFYPYARVD